MFDVAIQIMFVYKLCTCVLYCVISIVYCLCVLFFFLLLFFFQAEDGIRDLVRSRGLGDVYKRQGWDLKFNALVEAIYDFDWHVVRSEAEALLLEGKLIKEFQLSLIHI